MDDLLSEEGGTRIIFSALILRHVPILLRWLVFVAHYSKWVYWNVPFPSMAGPITATVVLWKFYNSDELRVVVWEREDSLDLVLWLWMFQDMDSNPSINLNKHFTKSKPGGQELVMLMTETIDNETLMAGTDYARLTFEARHLDRDDGLGDANSSVLELNTCVSPHSGTLCPVQALLSVSHGGTGIFQDPSHSQ